MPPPAYTPRKRLAMQVVMWAVLGVSLAAASVARPLGRGDAAGDGPRRLLGPSELRQFGPVVLRVPAGWSAYTPGEVEAFDPGDDPELPPGTVAVLQQTSGVPSLLAGRGSVRRVTVAVTGPARGGGDALPTPTGVLGGLVPAESRASTFTSRVGSHPAEGAEVDYESPPGGPGGRSPGEGSRPTFRQFVVCAVTPAGRVVTLSMSAINTDRDEDRAAIERLAAGTSVVE